MSRGGTSRSWRLALVSEHASPLATLGGVDCGGQNVYVAQLAARLATLGHRVDVFTRWADATQPAVVRTRDGARVVHVPAGPRAPVPKERLLPYMTEFGRFVRTWCARERAGYDCVHANFWMSGLVAAELKRETGTPFVVTFHALGRVRRLHQGDADGFPSERGDVEERIAAAADCVIAECPQDASDLGALYGVDPVRMRTVPCGVDVHHFRPIDRSQARAALGLPPEVPLVLQLGRLVPRKGIDTLVRALAILRDTHALDAQLIIVGGESEHPDARLTPEIGRLQAIAEAERVADRITFVGRRGSPVLPFYYSAADAFVTTPWYEPFGITPLEAMACGTPVIGAAVGGIRTTVVDGETGYLVPPRDPHAVAERLARVLREPDAQRRMGENGVRRVRRYYTWERVARTLCGIYGDVLAAHSPPVRGARPDAPGRALCVHDGSGGASAAPAVLPPTTEPPCLRA